MKNMIPYVGQLVRLGDKHDCRYGEISEVNHYTYRKENKITHRYQLWVNMLSGKKAFCDFAPNENGQVILL